MPERPHGYRSQLDGRGPHAWQQPLALRAPPRPPRRAHRLHLGRRPDRPAAPRRRSACRSCARSRTRRRPRSSRRRSSRRSRRRYEHQRALIDASPVAIVDFDFDGRVRSWNAGATEIFGWTAGRGDRPRQPDRPRRRAGRSSSGTSSASSDRRGAARSRLPSQPPRRIADRRQRLGRPDPRRDRASVVGVIALMVDVTARKRSERALADERGAQGRDPARGARLRRDRRPRRTRHRGESRDRGDVRLDAQRSDRQARSSS